MKQALVIIRNSDTDFRHHTIKIAEAVFSIEHSLCVIEFRLSVCYFTITLTDLPLTMTM